MSDCPPAGGPVPLCYDLLIRQAWVIDGTATAQPTLQDVAVYGDKIVAIGDLAKARAHREIDGRGWVLAPGFIDVHTHDDLELIRQPSMAAKLTQGVTTVITGNCGISATPLPPSAQVPDPMNLLGAAAEFCYPTFADFAKALQRRGPGVNVLALVGHTTLRHAVMQDLSLPATATEIAQMRRLLQQSLAEGAAGLSSGLAYQNAMAAPAAELEQLACALVPFGAIYTTHLRSEFDDILPALAEAAALGQQSGVPVVISHLKCAGAANWGRAQQVIDFIESKAATQPFSCDCYPYSASSSTLDLNQVTADFDIRITWSEPHPECAGLTLSEIAAQWQQPLLEVAAQLMPAGAVYHGMSEQDVQQFLAYPPTMIGSDGLPCDPNPHPRLWGAFPRVLGHYVRDVQLFSLAQAIHKMTGLSASNFKLAQRGFIQEGYYADLVLFDPAKIRDCASFSEPIQPAAGIHAVWVNGQLACQNGQLTPQRAGKFLTLASFPKVNAGV